MREYDSPKISCLPVSLFGDIQSGKISLKEWAHNARTLGLDAIDISIVFLKNHSPTYLRQVKQDLRDEDISILMATTYPDFTHPDLLQRTRELDYLRRDVALCSQIGIPYLRVLAGQAHPGVGRQQGIAWAVDHLSKAAAIARDYGVTLLYEDHAKPSAWDYVDFSFPPDVFLEIAGSLAGSGIGINFDTGNIVAYGADPFAVLNAVIDRVVTVHVSDTAEIGVFQPVEIGTGAVPNQAILQWLKARGFDGWLCIEEASGNGFAGIERAVKFVRDAWTDPQGGQDASSDNE